MLADLHLHTVLSPCAEVEMIPPLLVRRALELGLGLIAVTDHNSAQNCAAMVEAAGGSGLAILPGMETQTAEDVHVLCLFDTVEQALAWQEVVFAHLPGRLNPEAVLGAQYVVDAEGEYVGTEERLLLTGADLSLEDVVRRVGALGGLAIPAHVDRPAFSLLASLGFVPAGLDVPALEIFRMTEPAAFRARHPDLASWPLLRGSDAHRLAEMRVSLRLGSEALTVAGLRRALAGGSFSLA
jgi:PHP family Zn ribbon phosphoesterase